MQTIQHQDFLNGKLVGTANVITLTENNDGGNETLTLNIGTNVFNKATNTTDNITQGSNNKFYSDSLVSTYIGTQKGIANGLATLDASSKIPTSQLPDLAINKNSCSCITSCSISINSSRRRCSSKNRFKQILYCIKFR